jgi:hypothetical protein
VLGFARVFSNLRGSNPILIIPFKHYCSLRRTMHCNLDFLKKLPLRLLHPSDPLNTGIFWYVSFSVNTYLSVPMRSSWIHLQTRSPQPNLQRHSRSYFCVPPIIFNFRPAYRYLRLPIPSHKPSEPQYYPNH